MTQKEKIQQEIEKTLQSLDGVKRAEANPYLFTRIQARMNNKTDGWEMTFSILSKPVVALAMLILVMAINGWAIFGNSTNEVSTAENSNASVSELANQYNVVASVNNYDYANMTNE